MKKLAIFCDGTWQSLRSEASTNVVKLARSVAPTSAAGVVQLVYYDEGVGVGSEISPLVDRLTRYIGGALGSGLNAKIERAYQFIVLNFDPGDEIYVFGFSRGAYTARSLCGLIRKCGVLKRECFDQSPEVMRRYREPINPDDPDMVQFRRTYTHQLASGDEDHAGLAITPADETRAAAQQTTRADLYQYRPAATYRMMYAGIWDTVGELGVPRRLDVLRLDRRNAFHDTKGSSLIASIRHAVAADEQRELFDMTPYDNIRELNLKWAEHTGWNCDDPLDSRHVAYPWRPYQQRWFPGDHASVGGGYEETGMSNAALLWIAEGASWAGLCFSSNPHLPLAAARDHLLPFGDLGAHGGVTAPKGKQRRQGPDSLDEISDALWERWEKDTAFRPPNLTLMRGARPIHAEPAGFPAP